MPFGKPAHSMEDPYPRNPGAPRISQISAAAATAPLVAKARIFFFGATRSGSV